MARSPQHSLKNNSLPFPLPTAFVMDSATDFSSIATTSRASSSGCVDRESSGSFGQEGYERNADRPTTLQELRKGRSSRPSISQRYSPLATTRRAKTSKILDWVADVENVRPKNQYGVQNGVMDKSRLPDTVELLYSVQPSSSGCSSPISSRSFCSSVRATEGPAFATSSPCPTEIILSSSPHSQVSGHGMDWDTVGDLFERPEANDYRHTAAYSPPFSSKSSSYEFLVTGPSPLAEDDTFVDATFDRVNDKLTNELALRLHRIGRRSNEMESIEVEEEVCYTQGGVMQTTTTIHQHLHTSPSHQSAQPPTYCNCADGSCATSLCDASGTGRWNSKRGRDVYQRSPHAIVPEDPASPSSIDSFPMSTGGRPHNRPSFYGDNAQHSSGSHYSSYPPSAHGITPSSVTTSSDPHHHTSVSHTWDSCPIRPPMISPEVMSLAQPITIPLHQPQPVRPILTISISELASAEGYGGEHKLLQTPSKVRRGRLPKSERTSGVVQAPKWNGGVYSETYESTPRR